ncbi:MAG TPA: DUF711 family protein [Ktedonobacterales bacterium]|nr:DUF711 family protein [Ktedonobacterales bacterium]
MDVTIRTITLSIGDAHPLSEEHFARAAEFLAGAQAAAEAAGYTVQTVRIATRPVLADMAGTDDAAIEAYAASLQGWCAAYDMNYCSLGTAPADDPAFPVERIAILPRILALHEALNATVQLGSVAAGIRYEAALPTALAMRALAEHGGGDASFRFAALACCEPGGPFFPQAFAAGPEWSVSVGLQSAGLVRRTIAALAERAGPGLPALAGLTAAVGGALEKAARPVVDLVRGLAQAAGFEFGGIDLSPAPMGDESIADAIEAVGVGEFGGPGTLAIAAALTAAIKSPALPMCGYCGLMLPVLEDELLGERCAEGNVSVSSLLAYSAVCGTGLDTVPIPGDTPPERVAALLADVAALAVRLRKPLSARLFLVPGGAAGDMTNFASPYLTNTRILSV